MIVNWDWIIVYLMLHVLKLLEALSVFVHQASLEMEHMLVMVYYTQYVLKLVKYLILSYLIPDIDECELGLDNCLPNAICINTIGSFECICPPGFTGDGINACDGILYTICPKPYHESVTMYCRY